MLHQGTRTNSRFGFRHPTTSLNSRKSTQNLGSTRRKAGTTISASGSTISDSGNGLAGFLTGDTIRVAGSVANSSAGRNDGDYQVITGAVAGATVVDRAVKTETAGATIEIRGL